MQFRTITIHMFKVMLISVFYFIPSVSLGLTFVLPKEGNIVGSLQTATAQAGESLADIANRFDLGKQEIIDANPKLNQWTPGVGKTVIIPTQFILPADTREGIIVNLAELRLYLFHPDEPLVSTHPIGIGRQGWKTPLGIAKIIGKRKDPAWRPPQSIKNHYKRKGKILPDVVPPGPNNPLGQYAMRLSIPGYLIHGTDDPSGIGIRSSSGCIRMFPEDIQSLFYRTPMGTSVKIVHEPFKIGRKDNKVYLEAHDSLKEDYYNTSSEQQVLNNAFTDTDMENIFVNWEEAEAAIDQSDGYPIVINNPPHS